MSWLGLGEPRSKFQVGGDRGDEAHTYVDDCHDVVVILDVDVDVDVDVVVVVVATRSGKALDE